MGGKKNDKNDKFYDDDFEQMADDIIEPLHILDDSHEYYVIKEKFWDFGSGDIYNQYDSQIGKMKRKFFSPRAYTEIYDNDENMIFSLNNKLLAFRSTYDIKDENGEFLGRAKRKLLAPFRPKIWMENEDGDHILESQGTFMGWDFDVTDPEGNKVAEVGKLDKWKDLFLGDTVFDYSDKYALKVIDKKFDKRKLLGLVLAIDRCVHDD